MNGVTDAMVERLHHMIGKYWDLAYAEGKEGRGTDTHSAEAQRTWTGIKSVIAALSAQGQGEAVAWRVPIAGWFEYFRTEDQARAARAEYESDHEIDIESEDHAEPEPLYTAPPAQPAEQGEADGPKYSFGPDRNAAVLADMSGDPGYWNTAPPAQAERVPEESYRGVPFLVLGKAFQRVLADPSVLWRDNSGAQEFIDRVQEETGALLASPIPSPARKVCTRNCDCVGPCKAGEE